MTNLIKFLQTNTNEVSVAIVALILSIFNLIKSFWDNRSWLYMRYKSCSAAKVGSRKVIYFELAFENKSRLPISISRIFLHLDRNVYEFNWIPERILSTTFTINNELVDEKSIYSQKIPYTIEALGIWGGFYFIEPNTLPTKEEFVTSDSKIVVFTNRGKKTFKFKISSDTLKYQ